MLLLKFEGRQTKKRSFHKNRQLPVNFAVLFVLRLAYSMNTMKFTNSQKLGFVSCLLLIASCFLNWAWYPDLQKHFTAFFTEENHYGKPGNVFVFFAVFGLIFYVVNKPWSQRLNLIFGALCVAFALRTYLLFTSGYDGFVPEPKPGIFLMLIASFGHVIAAVMGQTIVKREVKEVKTEQASESVSA